MILSRSIVTCAGVLLGVVGILLVGPAGCAGSGGLDSGEAGKSLSKMPGAPVFDVEAVPVLLADTGGVEVHLRLLAGSLSYTTAGSGFIANYEVSIRLVDEDRDEIVAEGVWRETLTTRDYASTQEDRPQHSVRMLTSPPGTFILEVVVEDVQSAKAADLRVMVDVPAARSGEPSLGRILLSPRGSEIPLVAFHIPAAGDSLNLSIWGFHLPPSTPVRLHATAVRFWMDTLVAISPFYYTAGRRWSDMHRLVEDSADTIWQGTVLLQAGPATDSAHFVIPPCGPGMYQVKVTASLPSRATPGEDTTLSSTRFLGIMKPGFPRPTTLDDLIGPLAYLATEREYRAIDTIRNAGDRRKAFEKFWLSIDKDPERAAGLIKKFYGRVEEANKRFSTFKEGWKTDRGMLYVVLGPPVHTERFYDKETWYYTLPGTTAENTWQFRRIQFAPDHLLLDDYILQRGVDYEIFWQRMIAKWREGEVY